MTVARCACDKTATKNFGAVAARTRRRQSPSIAWPRWLILRNQRNSLYMRAREAVTPLQRRRGRSVHLVVSPFGMNVTRYVDPWDGTACRPSLGCTDRHVLPIVGLEDDAERARECADFCARRPGRVRAVQVVTSTRELHGGPTSATETSPSRCVETLSRSEDWPSFGGKLLDRLLFGLCRPLFLHGLCRLLLLFLLLVQALAHATSLFWGGNRV